MIFYKKQINFIYKFFRKIFQKIKQFSFIGTQDILIVSENNCKNLQEKINWYLPSKVFTIDTMINNNKSYDMILITKCKQLWDWKILKNIHKTKIVDPNFYGLVEVSNWNSLFFSTLTDHKKVELLDLYKTNFIKLKNQYAHYRKSSIFLTGPSIDQYNQYDFDDSLNIICNSIVRDKKLLAYIQPDIVVFSDPGFHFIHNEYSQQFRQDMLDCVKMYGCYIIVPDFVAPILLEHYPEIKNFIIAFPFTDNINFPSLDNFYVKGTNNILTLFMLPIASALTDDIYILGADGRKKEETYFWRHNSNVQYGGLMQKAFEAHPSFFKDQHYNDYYEEHCKMIEKYFNYGEKQNKHFFALTHSYIPALKTRYKEKLYD